MWSQEPVPVAPVPSLQEDAGAAPVLLPGGAGRAGWELLFLELPDGAHQLLKGLVHVEAQFGRGLEVGHVVGVAEGRGFGSGNLTLCLQICLVPDQHDGEVISVLDSEDLREELAHLVETLPIINGKHQQEAVAGAHVLLSHGTELLLACGVQDVQPGRDAIHGADLGVGVFNSGIVVRHEVGLDELDGQRALAHAAAAHDHQLVCLAGWGVPGSRPPAPGPPPPCPGRRPAAHVAAAAQKATHGKWLPYGAAQI